MVSSAPAAGADFIPGETFTGSKLGYVFQAGSLGTGYYKDGLDKGMSLPLPPAQAGADLSLPNLALVSNADDSITMIEIFSRPCSAQNRL